MPAVARRRWGGRIARGRWRGGNARGRWRGRIARGRRDRHPGDRDIQYRRLSRCGLARARPCRTGGMVRGLMPGGRVRGGLPPGRTGCGRTVPGGDGRGRRDTRDRRPIGLNCRRGGIGRRGHGAGNGRQGSGGLLVGLLSSGCARAVRCHRRRARARRRSRRGTGRRGGGRQGARRRTAAGREISVADKPGHALGGQWSRVLVGVDREVGQRVSADRVQDTTGVLRHDLHMAVEQDPVAGQRIVAVAQRVPAVMRLCVLQNRRDAGRMPGSGRPAHRPSPAAATDSWSRRSPSSAGPSAEPRAPASCWRRPRMIRHGRPRQCCHAAR